MHIQTKTKQEKTGDIINHLVIADIYSIHHVDTKEYQQVTVLSSKLTTYYGRKKFNRHKKIEVAP